MKTAVRALLFFAIVTVASASISATDVTGMINATWTKSGSPYIVKSDVTVAALTIEPGVTVKFDGFFLFEVIGRLNAVGTAKEPIVFTNNGGEITWKGIYVNGAQTASLAFCLIEWSDRSGVMVQSASCTLHNCIITNNYNFAGGAPGDAGAGSGVHVTTGGQATLTNCILKDNVTEALGYFDRGGAVFAGGNGRVTLKNCIIADNDVSTYPGHADAGGLYLGGDSVAEVTNCVIANNTAGAPGVVNSGALFLDDKAAVTVKNSILWGNKGSAVYKSFGGYSATATVTYSCVQGGDTGQGNIGNNPIFADDLFHLLAEVSPAIDTGDPATAFNDPPNPAKPGFALLPALGTIRNDMGAYGGPGAKDWQTLEQGVAGPNLIFADFVNGASGGALNRTRLVLRNTSSQPDTGTIRFLTSGGQPLPVPIGGQAKSSVDYSLPAWGTTEVQTDGTGDLVSGSIQVTSSRGDQSMLEGTVFFDVLGNYVSVGQSPQQSLWQVYVSVTSSENTGMAFLNASDEPVTLDVRLLNSEGVLKAERQVPLPAGQQMVSFVTHADLFQDFFSKQSGDFKGTLNISVRDGKKVSILGLIQRSSGGQLIAVSPSPHAFVP